jgi:hypothetical protein
MTNLNEVKTLQENVFQTLEKYKYVIKAPFFAIIKNADLVFWYFLRNRCKDLT